MKTISKHDPTHLAEVAKLLSKSRCACALTGAGISVASGIPDFRSPGGLWTKFAPDEYATLDAFLNDPDKAWKLYRALGKKLEGKVPSQAHHALADLEKQRVLKGVVTQNIDRLHHTAGNSYVFEIHGDHHHLHCLECDWLEPVVESHFQDGPPPACGDCSSPLKPNIVLFGENVRNLQEITFFIQQCDLLLVAGTSAQVYPAAGLPSMVKQSGGTILEFNREQALAPGLTDYFFEGDLEDTLPSLYQAYQEV